MPRFLVSIVVAVAVSGVLIDLAACSSTSEDAGPDTRLDAGPRRDGGLVEAPEAGAADAALPPAPIPSCEKYCQLVGESCTGAQAQYASKEECLGFCALLPQGDAGQDEADTLACRALYAGSPAKTDPAKYCGAAGPFGGGLCGDRCTAFCQLAVATCSPSAGSGAPYASYPDCATSCAGYAYKDAGVDGGGEAPTGPAGGDTLNCRLYQLREVVRDGSTSQGCADIGPDSGACKW